MAMFQPFRGVLYDDPEATDEGVLDVSSVIGESAESDFAVKHLARKPVLADAWLKSGRLHQDDQACLYMYRAGFHDEDGIARQFAGVFGLGEVSGDPIDLQPTVIQINEPEFDLLLQPLGMPLAVATAVDGTHYRLWPLSQYGVINTIAEAVAEVASDATGLLVASTSSHIPPPGLVFSMTPRTER